MKILILADIPGWIVDRIVDRMIQGIDFTFTKRYYASITTDQLIEEANQHDLVHYGNWDIQYHVGRLGEIKVPFLMSIRSHRFPYYVRDVARRVHVHVVNLDLHAEFYGSYYIPDGIFYQLDRPFTVGFSGKADSYKGFPLIAQACSELGVIFNPAVGQIEPEDMLEYYKSVDLVVVASEAEGFGTIVMECLAINKPVITTNVGTARYLDVYKIDRTVESIKNGILKFYTSPQVLPKYGWPNICEQFKNLYLQLGKKQ